jgi:hypothetical protein
MITVRLKGGKKVKVLKAVYVLVEEGGRVVLLDEARQVVREFPWTEVVAYSQARDSYKTP